MKCGGKLSKFKEFKIEIGICIIFVMSLFGWFIYNCYFTEQGRVKQCVYNYFNAVNSKDIKKSNKYVTDGYKDYAKLTNIGDYECIDITHKPLTEDKDKIMVATYRVQVNNHEEKRLVIELVDENGTGKYKINSLVYDEGLDEELYYIK